MSWKVFAGDHSDVFSALTVLRASRDGFEVDSEGLARCLRAHVQRGLTHISASYENPSLADFYDRWFAEPA